MSALIRIGDVFSLCTQFVLWFFIVSKKLNRTPSFFYHRVFVDGLARLYMYETKPQGVTVPIFTDLFILAPTLPERHPSK